MYLEFQAFIKYQIFSCIEDATHYVSKTFKNNPPGQISQICQAKGYNHFSNEDPVKQNVLTEELQSLLSSEDFYQKIQKIQFKN